MSEHYQELFTAYSTWNDAMFRICERYELPITYFAGLDCLQDETLRAISRRVQLFNERSTTTF